ncbi:DUF2637 domain-containing protein [Streptomyces sp. H10-C2]|uniref:DUF2637 domain-containing protein n=1 Tax=unclassified Streptomyces TaxID=2593676 RepID=UPI0024B921F0|nr:MULTISPECIES: DUF2637 domain-containing protein [unclassified Streptomyces]MDJ0342257.1 DUF2637 domain-containing protein [Streptomyces sp. PH10-H1]MDJ0368771.1 DUF2637 domain-containing protein [Streptomyces sp. H10-C2]
MSSPDDRRRERLQRALVGIVAAGAVTIAGIGFAGSYSAVRDLAFAKGFGWFAQVFPIGVDAGIVVLLALDLLLTWMRIPFPLLRQTAWLLTAATIAFNAALAWPDPIGVGMHGIIPVLFVVCVEAGRHAVGRIADITADKAMDGIRISRWFLAPVPTFRLWRRMKLWEIRSYDTVVRMEQDRIVYAAGLRAEYGWQWRRKAPVEKRMPLRLARYGIPVVDWTAPVMISPVDRTLPVLGDGTSPELDLLADQKPVETVAVSLEKRRPEGAPSVDASDGQADDQKPRRLPAIRRPKASRRGAGKKAPRRSLDEWVDLAGPIFHAEFVRLRRNPTANEFATAIKAARLGAVSDTRAKSIRAEILDRQALPSLD